MKHFNKESLNYDFTSKLESGIALAGSDVKSLRTQTPQFANSKVEIKDGEAYITNLKIPLYKYSHGQTIDATKERKLLLSQKEILKLTSFRNQKYMLIPISLFLQGKWFKLEIGVGKKMKKYEKREKIKSKELSKILK